MKLRTRTPSINRRPESIPPNESRGLRVPGATYRLQFTRAFTLRDALGLLDYLQGLGVTDIYASPLFEAGPDSCHGYDVCGHSRISDAVGGDEAFAALARELSRRGMGLLLDIVPNHMAVHHQNPLWWDVLKHGPDSRYARFFDIDWERGHQKVVLPVLGEDLEKVVAAGQLKLERRNDEPVLAYFEKSFPISPNSLRLLDGSPGSMAQLLAAQHYQLAHWRTGAQQINYRRFFDVNELVALRMEDSEVFAETHQLVSKFIRDGTVQGLRVDHPDGLRDPRGYFEQLQAAGGIERPPTYIVAEKILSHGERLPADWPVAGTTGYDFLNDVNALFVAKANEGAMTAFFREFTGCAHSFGEVAYRAKKRVLEKSFASEVSALARQLTNLTRHDESRLRAALVDLMACFPVYRTYARHGDSELDQQDAAVVKEAIQLARSRASELGAEFDLLEKVFSFDAAFDRRYIIQFILRFQQFTGPAAAKGIEDTAFYRYNRLISLNEVGGEPAHFGISVDEFHQRNLTRSRQWPHSLLATATHDTKRGEDVRARINVLSELPAEWQEHVMRWHEINKPHKTLVNGEPAPDANDEYLFYQTLIGAWNDTCHHLRERIVACMLKAIKEAKRKTSWLDPNPAYESATQSFVERVLAHETFRRDFLPFQQKVARFGRINSLAQTLLKLTAPGVPDIYQGTESWDFSLVDPDNRRAVDFASRRALLDSTRADDASSKIRVVSRSLHFRQAHRHLFDHGTYEPLRTDSDHVVAFARRSEHEHCIVIVPRLPAILMSGKENPVLGKEVWTNQSVQMDMDNPASARTYRNILTDEKVPCANGRLLIADALTTFPVALLKPE